MEPILSCKNISKRFSGTQALKDVELNLYSGEIHALIGENGAGKSTLIKILSGIYIKDAGEIKYNGKKVEIDSIDRAKELGIAVIHQELSVVKALTAAENVFLGKEIIKNKIFSTLDSKEMIKKSKEIFEILGVSIPLNIKAKDLSIAQCQLIEIAKALREDAKALILDEPTTALTSDEVESLF
jgi:ribose transport system ATP-binding protein